MGGCRVLSEQEALRKGSVSKGEGGENGRKKKNYFREKKPISISSRGESNRRKERGLGLERGEGTIWAEKGRSRIRGKGGERSLGKERKNHPTEVCSAS